MSNIHWQCLSFEQLTPQLLYHILQARSDVFVVEQACAYQEMDGKDNSALHLCGWQYSGQPTDGALPALVAYARLLPPGVSYREASIGRVMTARTARTKKLGRPLMQQALTQMALHYPGQSITIGAQNYLRSFYQSLGFETISAVYDEDGIDHVDMRYTPAEN
jgi:ElaA protein